MSYIKHLPIEYRENNPEINAELLLQPKGFLTAFGYKGLVNNKYQLFATEQEYKEVLYNE